MLALNSITVMSSTIGEMCTIRSSITVCHSSMSDFLPLQIESLFLGYKLLPSKMSSLTEADVVAIEHFYGPDLPDRDAFKSEVEKWKVMVGQSDNSSMPKHALSTALQEADSIFSPNIHEIMRLIYTLSVGSVPCERSFSAMRRLKDWSRSSMTESRLNGLALLYTHREMEVNFESVLRRFDATGRLGHFLLYFLYSLFFLFPFQLKKWAWS